MAGAVDMAALWRASTPPGIDWSCAPAAGGTGRAAGGIGQLEPAGCKGGVGRRVGEGVRAGGGNAARGADGDMRIGAAGAW